MLNSRKSQIVIVLILACILMPVFSAEPNEPNEPKTELKFKTEDLIQTRQRWSIGSQPGRGPIKPAYVAKLFIKQYGNIPGGGSYGIFNEILQTEISKSMTPKQKEFIKTSSSYSRINQNLSDMPIGYLTIRLYAVSEEDAKKMALAFIELLNKRAQERIQDYKVNLKQNEKILTKAKKELPEKEAKLKDVVKHYEHIKSKTHQFSNDNAAVELAKTSITEMDKTLNKLEIELAGIQERLKTIETYRNQQGLRAETHAHLDQMYIELMIELNGLEARKKATEKIRRIEEEFVNWFNEREKLSGEVSKLNETIKTRQTNIEQLTGRLNNPTPRMQPPEIYQNTVTIYPVFKNN